jgi:hypothetical protein
MFFVKKDGCHEYCCTTIHGLGDSHSTLVADVVLENSETEIGSLQRSALEKSFGRSESKISISAIDKKPSSVVSAALFVVLDSRTPQARVGFSHLRIKAQCDHVGPFCKYEQS